MRRLRFGELTAKEERTLREAYQGGPKYEFRMRCLWLRLSHQRYSTEQLAAHFEVSRHTIYDWLNAWQCLGLSGLYRHAGQGRKKAAVLAAQPKP